MSTDLRQAQAFLAGLPIREPRRSRTRPPEPMLPCSSRRRQFTQAEENKSCETWCVVFGPCVRHSHGWWFVVRRSHANFNRGSERIPIRLPTRYAFAYVFQRGAALARSDRSACCGQLSVYIHFTSADPCGTVLGRFDLLLLDEERAASALDTLLTLIRDRYAWCRLHYLRRAGQHAGLRACHNRDMIV
jgi:hypothetical protein